jgi:Leucine rich repeat
MKIFVTICAIFISSIAGISINCSFHSMGWHNFPSGYGCIVMNIDNISDETVTNVNGTHQTGMSNANVTQVWFGHSLNVCQIEFIPKGIGNFFSNVWGVMFSCRIENINEDDLTGLPHLMYIDLRSNRIARIPPNFFSLTPKVTHVSFISNQIRHVGENVLNDLPDLTFAHFILNICVDFYANSPETLLTLMQLLRTNCPDIATSPGTTTTITYTTPTTIDPSCPSGNTDQRICDLEETVNEELRADNQRLNAKVNELSEQMQEVMEKLLELTSRPCTCK